MARRVRADRRRRAMEIDQAHAQAEEATIWVSSRPARRDTAVRTLRARPSAPAVGPDGGSEDTARRAGHDGGR